MVIFLLMVNDYNLSLPVLFKEDIPLHICDYSFVNLLRLSQRITET